ncbi:hypothetical protein AAE02nite_31270 [Adhaeribacter aerolatus]|uniref:HMA domain-containing protein n=1 Tax=Adhaeribacter aerolatus TaxID=670289 RepID=A0A512B0I1_9BACT|nr:heavy metal-associated domain-containing protein [Adhaeribacter aerolatus]GEO05463.1 hypothetical protein AAE02nite_31270 [Adhaeribacter aerolatus]
MKALSFFKMNVLAKSLSLFSFIFISFVLPSCGQNKSQGTPAKTNAKEQVTAGPSVKTVTMPVEGMSCSSCVSNVKKTVKALAGVQNVAVSLERRQATITYAQEQISPEQISKAINDKGYKTGKAIAEKEY